MRVLVLGGNGFVGSHLVDALVARGAKVRLFDRPGSLKSDPVRGVEYRYADFADPASVSEALVDIDLVAHLISTSVPSTSNLDPVSDIEGNLISTVRLLQQMHQTGARRLIFLSSGGTVYGNPSLLPVAEDQPRDPISSYGVIKVAIESYVFIFGVQHGLKATVLRPSNPYGPRQGHIGVQGVIPTFFHRLLESEPIRIWGDGSVVRDFVYVDDLVALIVAAAHSEAAGVFNVGSGQGTSLTQLLDVMRDVSGVEPRVEYLPGRPFDVKSIVLDITKVQAAFDWSPKVTLREGCARYWAWLRRESNADSV